MNKDYVVRIDNDDKVYKKYLDTRTYHKTIRGFDMFVYRHANNNWVCTDTVTGACIDGVFTGHKTKKAAFESAINFYSGYTGDQIKNARKNALERFKSDGII